MTTPCDLAWGHLDVNVEIPPLTVGADASAWKAAIEIRRKLMELILSRPVFFHFYGAHEEQLYVDGLARKVVEQGADQLRKKFNGSGEPSSQEMRRNMLGTLVGAALHTRPFAEVSDVTGELPVSARCSAATSFPA